MGFEWQRFLRRIVVKPVRRCDVFCDIDQYRPFSSFIGNAERVAQRVGQILDPVDEKVVFGDRQSDAGDAYFLKSVAADRIIIDVACDGDQGNTVKKRGRDAGHKICSARPAGRKDDSCFSGCAGIPVGGMAGSLFMGSQYVVNLILVIIKRVIYIECSSAGIAEYSIDSLFAKHFHNDLGSVKFHILYELSLCSFLFFHRYL